MAFLISIAITITLFVYLTKYKNVSNEDVRIMVGGSCLFGAISALSFLIVALLTPGAGVLAFSHFISLLLNGALSFYFLRSVDIL